MAYRQQVIDPHVAAPGMLMKFIKIEWNDEWCGFWLDPSGYLAELPKLAAEMPNGASEFALQDGHYNLQATWADSFTA
jgi:hypothetical protein